MSQRAKRVDSNQPEIVKLFRQFGATVAHTHQLGAGFPDIVVGYRGKNYMIEIKDGSLCKSRQALTESEEKFHNLWRGRVDIITSAEDVIAFMRRVSCER